ncbi:MAG: bifunctional diaminohydroxyphosphoribosylaminopyrimidine deaminase/5-amino-6-(5-phosphoribosylamino)uracil reductase RibD [Bacteroidia bacterium]
MSSAHEHFIFRCLQLAKKGINHVHPNPMVGCVITIPDEKANFGERIIGEGYHKKYGGPHAEVNAINSVDDQSLLTQSTAYVSLEPCSHFGKTPPCANLLIEKKVKKVVVASLDPNPLVAGRGIKMLQDAGIDVHVNVLQTKAEDLNRRFYTFHQKKRPYVTLKWAQTQNGFINDASKKQTSISNPLSQQIVHQLRSTEAAIMIGANTAKIDNPSLTTRNWAGQHPVRVLLDAQLSTSMEHKLFTDGFKSLVFNEKRSGKDGEVNYIDQSPKDLNAVLEVLHELGINSVLVEGGSQVLQSFINENLWDEAFVFESRLRLKNGVKAPEINLDHFDLKNVGNNILKHYINR